MKASQQSQPGVLVLRPWPFGPPLRGRAPHQDAGLRRPLHAHRLQGLPALSVSAPWGGPASGPALQSVR